MARLRKADPSGPGIERRRRGRGFEYFDQETGEKVDEDFVLERISSLAIPPAWKEVWICADEMGHLQAIGVDAAGRRQYLYHERWRARRDQEKFDRMLRLARVLPLIRVEIDRQVHASGASREKVLACSIRLLDRGFFRIGGEDYAEAHETYGLATIKKRHVTIADDSVLFDYNSKGGLHRRWSLIDPDVAEVLRMLKRRRGGGDDLLAYKRGRVWVDVRSAEINEYLKSVAGEEFTAKDFRTWSGTVLASVALAVSGGATSSTTSKKRAVTRAVKEVAHYLGNTPTVARKSYIDPRVIDRYNSGWTIRPVLDDLGTDEPVEDLLIQGRIEEAVLDLIEDHMNSDQVDRVA